MSTFFLIRRSVIHRDLLPCAPQGFSRRTAHSPDFEALAKASSVKVLYANSRRAKARQPQSNGLPLFLMLPFILYLTLAIAIGISVSLHAHSPLEFFFALLSGFFAPAFALIRVIGLEPVAYGELGMVLSFLVGLATFSRRPASR